MGFLGTLLYFVILLAVMFGIMILGRKYLFSKVKINKWIPLGIAIVLLIIQFILPMVTLMPVWVSFIVQIITLSFFIWFLDIQTTGGPKQKEKDIKIVPKAKPNRVKHLQSDQIYDPQANSNKKNKKKK